MDPNTLKVLLNSQEKAFRAAMDIITDHMKERIATLESRVGDLVKSLEFTQAEVHDLKAENKTLQKSGRENRTLIDEYKARVEDMDQRLNYQEDYNHRLNLRFSGVQELSASETWEETATLVQKLIEDKLQLPSMSLERAHRVGPVDPSRPRTIVARFEKFADRETALRNARKLKGSGIFINEDLCAASQALRTSQLPQLKQARKDGKIAFFRYTKLIIKDRPMHRPNNTTSTSHLSTTTASTSSERANTALLSPHGGASATTASTSSERANPALLNPNGGAADMTAPAAGASDHSHSDGARGVTGTTEEDDGGAVGAAAASDHARIREASNPNQRLRDRKNNKKK